jgi:hypothetical protein
MFLSPIRSEVPAESPMSASGVQFSIAGAFGPARARIEGRLRVIVCSTVRTGSEESSSVLSRALIRESHTSGTGGTG